MKIYVAGPMRGLPEFNFPAFNAAAALLREAGHTVFNPAERDNERHGTDISVGNTTGDESVAVAVEKHGFSLRVALADDLGSSAIASASAVLRRSMALRERLVSE